MYPNGEREKDSNCIHVFAGRKAGSGCAPRLIQILIIRQLFLDCTQEMKQKRVFCYAPTLVLVVNCNIKLCNKRADCKFVLPFPLGNMNFDVPNFSTRSKISTVLIIETGKRLERGSHSNRRRRYNRKPQLKE